MSEQPIDQAKLSQFVFFTHDFVDMLNTVYDKLKRGEATKKMINEIVYLSGYIHDAALQLELKLVPSKDDEEANRINDELAVLRLIRKANHEE
jgi:hypothetical protein